MTAAKTKIKSEPAKPAMESRKMKKAVVTETAPLRYFEAKGGRKTAVARIRLFTKKTGISVNGKDLKQYFSDPNLEKRALSPLETMNIADKLGATIKVSGGGLSSQAEAIANALARALLLFNPDFRKRLRKMGF